MLCLPVLSPSHKGEGIRQAAAAYSNSIELTGDLVIAKLLERNRLREARLRQYSVPSTYRIKDGKGVVSAEVKVMLQYRAPDTKEFTIVSETGSAMIRNRVFKPLMQIEIETAAGRSRYDSSITSDNYSFTLLGEENLDMGRCFVVQATAKRADKYLFNGKIWVHAAEFALLQIAGRPAKNPSFWIKRVDFVRRYQKLKEFWLPLNNESITYVRIFGKQILTIDYDDYEIAQVGAPLP